MQGGLPRCTDLWVLSGGAPCHGESWSDLQYFSRAVMEKVVQVGSKPLLDPERDNRPIEKKPLVV